MNINPLAAAQELQKYLEIITIAKRALTRATSGQNNDAIRADLEAKLDACDFTKIIPNYQGPCAPLHSSNSYLNDQRALEEQVRLADEYASQILIEIKKAIGPQYVRQQIQQFRKTDTKTLSESWSTPITVDIYEDSDNGVFIQVDKQRNRYRTALDGNEFGPWKGFLS